MLHMDVLAAWAGCGEGLWHGFPRIALGAGNGEEQAPPTNLDPLQLYTHVHAGEHFS